MNRPSVIIAVGALGLLSVALVAKQCGTSDSGESGLSKVRVASLPAESPAERGGWITRPDTSGAPGSAGGTRAGNSAPGSPGGGVADVQGDVRSSGGIASVGRSGGVAAASRRGASNLGRGGESAESGSIRVGSEVPQASLPFEEAERRKSLSRNVPGETGEHNTSVKSGPAGNEGSSGDQPDENGPTLSLPFDNSTLPDKGDTAPVVEKGVTLTNDGGATFSADSQFVIPDAAKLVGDSAATFSFWVSPQWSGDDEGNASLVQMRADNMWEDRLSIGRNGKYLRFLVADNTGVETDTSTTIENWQPGDRYHVTATIGPSPSGGQQTSLYINGNLVAQRTLDGKLEVPQGTGLYIGSDHPGSGPGAQATIGDVLVYPRVLRPEEVAGLSAPRQK